MIEPITYSPKISDVAPILKVKTGKALGVTGDDMPSYSDWAWDDGLEVVSITHRSNGDLNECVLKMHLGAGPEVGAAQIEMEDVDTYLKPNDMVQVWIIGEDDYLFFYGFVVNVLKSWGSGGQEVNFICVGSEYRINDASITGSYTVTHTAEADFDGSSFDSDDVTLVGRDCHFNVGGNPNMSEYPLVDTSFSYSIRLFDGEEIGRAHV